MNCKCKLVLSAMAVVAVIACFQPVASDAQEPAAAPVVEAKFEKTVWSNAAKVGDTLTVKTLNAVKLPDNTILPKGSKLIAKVSMAQSKKAGDGTSMLLFRFDQAEPKGGAAVAIKGSVTAIGPALTPDSGLGQGSVMARGGQGSTPGTDANAGLGKAGAKDEFNIAPGSTLEGVGLGVHKDADWTTALRGFKTDIRLDSDVIVKIELR